MNSVLLKNKKKGYTILPNASNWGFYVVEGDEETLDSWWYVGLIYETSVSQRQSLLGKLHIWHYVAEQDRQELAGQEGVGGTPAQLSEQILPHPWPIEVVVAAEGNPLTLVLGLQTYGTRRGNLTLASDKDFSDST